MQHKQRPQAGRLFQVLLASAKREILITSPYFLPDESARQEMIKAVQRGVSVRVITPGDHADHLLTRRSSRSRYGDLLKGGVRISEYQPAMIHAKILLIDGSGPSWGRRTSTTAASASTTK